MLKNYFNLKGSLSFIVLFLSVEVSLAQTAQFLTWNSNIYRITGQSNNHIDFRFNSSEHIYVTTQTDFLRFNTGLRSNTGEFGSFGSVPVIFNTNGTERMRIMNTNGFVGINNISPSHHLQIFGNTDYYHGGTVMMNDSTGNQASDFTAKSSTNMGKSARISLTNSITGNNATDGCLIMQNENNLNIWNQENGVINLKANNLNYRLYGTFNRALLGGTGLDLGQSKYALQTILSYTDNGLYVQTNTASKYGVSVQVKEETSTVFESTYAGESEAHFRIYGNGEVYARKYITTLNPFPDYVFSDNYKLMSYQDLRNYIRINRHLPNVPKATTVEENGMDLGELNRILVEKVEELTLYILELEDRLSEIEKAESPTNGEENALVERISRLEALLEEMKN